MRYHHVEYQKSDFFCKIFADETLIRDLTMLHQCQLLNHIVYKLRLNEPFLCETNEGYIFCFELEIECIRENNPISDIVADARIKNHFIDLITLSKENLKKMFIFLYFVAN